MVFIDRRMSKIDNMSMSRMFADSAVELDAMAAKLGLDPSWKFQADTPVAHFLLTSNKRMMAVRNGGILMSTEEVIARIRQLQQGGGVPVVAPEWEPMTRALAEMAELTSSLGSAVPTVGLSEAKRRWVNGMRRVVKRIVHSE